MLSQQHHSTVPRVKERSNLAQEVREQRYAKALKGLEDGTYKTLSEVVVPNKLSKSSLGHRRNGRRSRQEAHRDEQTFSPAAEKAVVKWILNLNDYGFSLKVDILMGLVNISLRRRIPCGRFQKTPHRKPYWQELDHPIFEPPSKPRRKVSRIGRQRAYAGEPRVL